MVAEARQVFGTYTAAANVLQTMFTTTNPTRLREMAIRNGHASSTARVKLYINTFNYLTVDIPPLDGIPLDVGAFIAGGTGVQMSSNLAGSVLTFADSWIDDVNNPAGGPTLVGARGYYAPGAPNTVVAIWTPPVGGSFVHRLHEVALSNLSLTNTYRFTLWWGTAGYPFFSIALGPDETIPFVFKSQTFSNTPLGLAVDATDNVTQWHYTGTTDVNNVAAV